MENWKVKGALAFNASKVEKRPKKGSSEG